MAAFLKIVSGVYLILVWLLFVLVVLGSSQGVSAAMGTSPVATNILAFVICITLSIPAVALFAFGQVVGDVRAMRRHLHAMHTYYEPGARS